MTAILTSCGSKVSSFETVLTTDGVSTPGTDITSLNTSSIVSNQSLLYIEATPKQEYQLYDKIDLSDLVVKEVRYENGIIASEEEITDYSLAFEDTSIPLRNGMLLDEVGDFTILVSKTGFQSAQFDVHVSDPINIKQYISVAILPNKTSYQVGEKLDPTGLEALLYTSYDGDGSGYSQVDVLSDYSLSIEGVSIQEAIFSKTGTYTVKISAKGYKGKELTGSFAVLVEEANASLIKPTVYNDPSISWEKDTTKMTVSIQNPTKQNQDKGYYGPDEVENVFGLKELGRNNAYNWHYTPSIGKVPLLVVPVVVPGYEAQATEVIHNRIKKAFFGNSKDLNFESLHSYYMKSSFNQLDFTGTVTDYFYPSIFDPSFSKPSNFSSDTLPALAEDCLAWAKQKKIDLTQYDSNRDGTIDGLWMIYIGPRRNSNSDWWAFTTTTGQESEDLFNPVANSFAWAGYDFLSMDAANADCDAHVLIHETGHMMGLMDYYSYGYDSTYGPLGGMDMMDYNFGDHNPYSKLLLGWIKPYLVTGNATITIDSAQNPNSVIILPDDDKTYYQNKDGKVYFNAFDEYLLLDYYTDKNLYTTGYDAYNGVPLEGEGGRLYHADGRLGSVYVRNNEAYFDRVLVEDEALFTSTPMVQFISNSNSGNASEQFYGQNPNWDELRWISQNGVYISKRSTGKVTDNSLFKEGNSFSLNRFYQDQFNNGKFDDGKPFSYSFTVDSIA